MSDTVLVLGILTPASRAIAAIPPLPSGPNIISLNTVSGIRLPPLATFPRATFLAHEEYAFLTACTAFFWFFFSSIGRKSSMSPARSIISNLSTPSLKPDPPLNLRAPS